MLAAARLAGLVALFAAASVAAEVRIAWVGALSGPAAWAGRDQRDAFVLALAQRNGRLGGVAVRFTEIDDGGDARHAPAVAARLAAESVHIVTGLTTTASTLALHARLRGKPMVLLSSGAGPLALAGEECSTRFYSTAAPDDAVHENAGAIANSRRYARVRVIGASQKERGPVEAAFRRAFGGEVAWTTLQQDPSGAIREIRAAPPAAVYLALGPEAMLRFLKAYADVGLFHRIPVIAAGIEPPLLDALGPGFSGLIASARWAAGMERPASTQFADAFRSRYARIPSSYAMQSFDAALILDQALDTAKSTSVEALAAALAAARVDGVAQPLAFAANGFAATDWHAWEVFNESSGAPYLAPRERTLRNYARAAGCEPRRAPRAN
jgi:branched-chain amino acid transport system substrate-binding protein